LHDCGLAPSLLCGPTGPGEGTAIRIRISHKVTKTRNPGGDMSNAALARNKRPDAFSVRDLRARAQ
jgi:hypothetical protein